MFGKGSIEKTSMTMQARSNSNKQVKRLLQGEYNEKYLVNQLEKSLKLQKQKKDHIEIDKEDDDSVNLFTPTQKSQKSQKSDWMK